MKKRRPWKRIQNWCWEIIRRISKRNW